MTSSINEQSIRNEEKNSTISPEEGSAFSGLINLNDISTPTTKTHLLLSKPPVHQIEAGLNPLVDAAAPVFTLMGQLAKARSHDHLDQLHHDLIEKINDFQELLQSLHYSPECLAEFNPISSYILCTTIDDIISNTPWGGQDQWKKYNLLNSQNILTRESFLILLERFIHTPESYIDMMEFIYICLNLGFKYSYHSSGFSAEQLQKIMHSLYKHIRAYRGNINKTLSPYTTKSIQPAYFKQNWKTKLFRRFKRSKKSASDSKLMAKYPLIADQVTNLENRLKNVVSFLKKKSITIKGNKVKLNALPWVLFVGSSNAGKTTLIENSNIKFIVNKKSEVQKTIDQADHWDWWVTPEAVLIDIPGHYSPHTDNDNILSMPWEHLLDLIQQERGKYGLNSVALAMSYSEIIDKANRHKLIHELSLRIKDLHDKFGIHLPFYLVVTKCDLMPGFADFFADYTQEELNQIWGSRLPHSSINQSLIDIFNHRFNYLIKQVNNQLIYRLQQEKDFDIHAKFRIKDFPLQMEQLKEGLIEVIKGLLREDSFLLNGFYLTSANQSIHSEHTTNLPQVFSGNEFLQSLSIMETPVNARQSYFIKHLLLHGLITDQNALDVSNQTNNNLLSILHNSPKRK